LAAGLCSDPLGRGDLQRSPDRITGLRGWDAERGGGRERERGKEERVEKGEMKRRRK